VETHFPVLRQELLHRLGLVGRQIINWAGARIRCTVDLLSPDSWGQFPAGPMGATVPVRI
jgi:hypothetical protein